MTLKLYSIQKCFSLVDTGTCLNKGYSSGPGLCCEAVILSGFCPPLLGCEL